MAALAATLELVGGLIEPKVADRQARHLPAPCPANQVSQARFQFFQRERLGEVIVRTALESKQFVFLGIACGQHEHGG